MANIIIKKDEHKQETEKILRDYHRDSRTATPEQRESAEYVVYKMREIREENRK